MQENPKQQQEQIEVNRYLGAGVPSKALAQTHRPIPPQASANGVLKVVATIFLHL